MAITLLLSLLAAGWGLTLLRWAFVGSWFLLVLAIVFHLFFITRSVGQIGSVLSDIKADLKRGLTPRE